MEDAKLQEHGTTLRQAFGRLSELAELAARQGLYGRVGVEIIFQAGKPDRIDRIYKGTDKMT